MDTFPSPPPKDASREPSVSYRTIATYRFGPPIPASPATTILPSGWIATVNPSSSADVISVRTIPSCPNVGSRSPEAACAVGAAARRSTRPSISEKPQRRRLAPDPDGGSRRVTPNRLPIRGPLCSSALPSGASTEHKQVLGQRESGVPADLVAGAATRSRSPTLLGSSGHETIGSSARR
jgi:hypothetical protein